MNVQNRTVLEQIHEEHRQLALLQALLRLPGYAANSYLLRDYLDTLGLVASRDVVHSDLRRLEDIGLCKFTINAQANRVTLTDKGRDVAEGRLRVEGVRNPEPGCC